ncbi:MAG: aminopeptidase P family protein, partial [Alphaproteobacteria bacterium]|nr:aminopeptidase P family protein [Alphaproteobacteria bacterium]
MTNAEKLQALRAEMTKQGLNALLIPMTDEYQNEYVPQCAKRLAFLCGFTGSAGFVVVTETEAAFFTDGRYTLQAKNEIPADLYKVFDYQQTPAPTWLEERLKKNDVVGYDPWLHTPAHLQRYTARVEAKGATLKAVTTNPVYAIWHNRPAPPATMVEDHPINYAGVSRDEKMALIAQKLTDAKQGATIITDPASVAWLLNVRARDVAHTPLPLSYAIVHAGGRVQWFIEQSRLSNLPPLPSTLSVHPPRDFLSELKKLGAEKTTVRIDLNGVPAAIVDALKQAGATVVSGDDLVMLPRAQKNATEIQGFRNAHVRDGVAMVSFLAWWHREKNPPTEMLFDEKLRAYRQKQEGFVEESFPSICGVGAHGAIIHYRATATTNSTARNEDMVLIDSGGQYRDATTDITRTLCLGAPTPQQKKHYTLVLKGHVALSRAVFPMGTKATELDVLARMFLWREGLDYAHGTGHGVGSFLGVHEGPQSIGKPSTRASPELLPGMLDREATIALWEELMGRPATNVAFYELLAGFQFCLVMVKLSEMFTGIARV